MADQNRDSDLDTGVQGTQNPDASQDLGDKRGSEFDAAQVQADLETLTQSVQGLSKAVSTMQSGKDRAVKDVKREVGELRSLLGDYEQLKERLGPDGAIEQLELKQQLSDIQERLASLSNPSSVQVRGDEPPGAFDTAKAVEEIVGHGLDANAPDFIKMLKSGLTKEKLDAYIVDRTRLQPPASPAGGATEPARGGVPPKENVETLTAEYQQKMVAAQGNPSLAKALKAEYAKKGVPVDSVVFH